MNLLVSVHIKFAHAITSLYAEIVETTLTVSPFCFWMVRSWLAELSLIYYQECKTYLLDIYMIRKDEGETKKN